jgi:hypothetical protein
MALFPALLLFISLDVGWFPTLFPALLLFISSDVGWFPALAAERQGLLPNVW